MEGYPNGSFGPKDNATRAEAAAILARLHQLVQGENAPGKDITYHKVTFGLPDGVEYDSSLLPEDMMLTSGTLIYTLPAPETDGYTFLGWYYDKGLTAAVGATDTVTADMTLYPLLAGPGEETTATTLASLNYVAALDVDPTYTVQVKAKSEDHIRKSITFIDASNFGEDVPYTVISEGGGIYTIKPNEPLTAGGSYQLNAVDRDEEMELDDYGSIIEPEYILFLHEGEVQHSAVRYYNITVYAREYSNLRLNDDVVRLHIDQVSGFSFEDTALYSTDLETINANSNDGNFYYEGDALKVGDIAAIYDGVLNDDMTVEGDAAYVQIVSIEGTRYNYVLPEIGDVMFLPKALPVPMDDPNTEAVEGAFFKKNTDDTIVVYNEYLDFSRYADVEQLELDGSTTPRVGDYLVLFEGEMTDTEIYSYWEILSIQEDPVSAETSFTAKRVDEFADVSGYEVYGGELAVDAETLAAAEKEAETNALESGFAEQAAEYLATAILNEEEIQDSFEGYSIENITVYSSGESRAWNDGGEWDISADEEGRHNINIQAGQIEAGLGTIMVEVGEVKANANATRTLQEITAMSGGVRMELGITFPVQIGTYLLGTGWSDCIYLEVSATFVQEVAFRPFASIDVKWDTWFIFPYIEDIVVSAGTDVGSYTGVGATFTVSTGNQYDTIFPWVTAIKSIDPNYDPTAPNVKSIAKQLESMMNNTTTFLDGYEGDSLISRYQDLLDNETDYVDILPIRLAKLAFKLWGGVIAITLTIEFAISAKMSVTIGTAAEILSVKRYAFTLRLFKGKASSHQMDLQTPYIDFNFYAMGNLGLRVGPRITVQIAALSGAAKKHNLVNVGYTVHAGAQIDLYGIFFYHFRMEGGRTKDSRGVGALEVNAGIFLDLDFFFGAFLDLVSANLHALDISYQYLTTKDQGRVMEACKVEHQVEMANDEPFTIPKYYLNMNTLNVRSGETGRRSNLDYSDFSVTLSNPNFHYNKSTGTITVTQPDPATIEMDCEMVMTYEGDDTLFKVTPIEITLDIKWEKTDPRYTLRFYSDTFYGGRWTQDGYTGLGYHADWKTQMSSKVLVSGEIISNISVPEAPSKAGYDFAGWRVMSTTMAGVNKMTSLTDLNNLEGLSMPEGNIEIAAWYNPRHDTPYTVEYYIETEEGNGVYELYKSAKHIGTTGTDGDDSEFCGIGLKNCIAEDIGDDLDGFIINLALYPQINGRCLGWFYIKGDGSTVVRVYYDRLDYSVYFHADNEDYSGSQTTFMHGPVGSRIQAPELTDMPGWNFVGWSTSQTDPENNLVDPPMTIPVGENRTVTVGQTAYNGRATHYFAIWKPTYNYITVNHYLEQPDGTYELYETQVGSNESEETHAIGGLTNDYIDVDDYLIEIDQAQFSHYDVYDADGMEDQRIVGKTMPSDEVPQHNGQTLDIYYDRQYYRITWKDKDGDIVQYYYTGQQIVAPEGLDAEPQEGYVIDGWKNCINPESTEIYRDNEVLILDKKAMTFEPNYAGADGTKYTVVHRRVNYNQDEDNVEETEYGYGTTDTIVEHPVKTYTGYDSPDPKSIFIKADGSAKLTYEYKPKTFTVTCDFAGGTEKNYARNYYYDTAFNLPNNVEREGYTFLGWQVIYGQGDNKTTEFYKNWYSIPVDGGCLTSLENLTFVAQWEAIDVTYKVVTYTETLTGTYTKASEETITEKYGTEVTAQQSAYTGYTLDTTVEGTKLSGTVPSVNDELVLSLYYKRNSYTATWYDYDGTTVLAEAQFKYLQDITLPETIEEPTRTGYTFDGWDIGTPHMTSAGASYNAKDHGTWTANTYTVTFDPNDGTGTMADQTYTYDVSGRLTANAFERTGYTFAGWSTEETGAVTYTDQERVSNLAASGNVTLYAQWTGKTNITYKVAHYGETVDGTDYTLLKTEGHTGTAGTIATGAAATLNGFTYDSANTNNVTTGTIAGDGTLVLKLYYTRNSYDATWCDYDGNTLTTTTFKYGQTITAPDATDSRTGYTFGGWDIGTVTMGVDGAAFNTKDHGIWNANTYTVTFYANDGTDTTATQTHTYDQTLALTANAFERSGYTFAGWSTEANGEVVYADQAEVKNLAVSGNVDLYAQWIAGTSIGYKVAHYGEKLDGTGYELLDTTNHTGTTGATATATAITKEGFTYDSANANNVATGTIAGDDSLVLKLYYTRNSYNATWYNYDGSTLTTTSFKYGQTITAPTAAATRTGYTFGGWNIGTVTMGASGATFKAAEHGIWTANTYTVTFHANDGADTDVTATQTHTYDQTLALTANAFERSGYTFAGWSTTADGAVVYADKEEVSNLADSGNVDLYAQWSDGTAKYTVEHYGETLDGTGYELIKTEELSGTTGTTVYEQNPELDGFAYDSGNGNNKTSGTVEADGSLVLKLYYTRNEYTLTVDFNGESMKQVGDTHELIGFEVEDRTFTRKYGESLSLPEMQITVWKDTEWVWDEEAQEEVRIEGHFEDVAFEDAFPGYTFAGWNNDAAKMPANDLTLTAQWTPVTVTITLNPGTNYSVSTESNEGEPVSGKPITVTAPYGSTVDISSYGFTLEGYFMVGWNHLVDRVSGAEITGEVVLVDEYYNNESGFTASTGKLNLYGFWIKEDSKCTITFNANGGTGAMDPQVVTNSGQWVALHKNEFVLQSYRFVGWNTAADGTGSSSSDCELFGGYGDITLYAQWELISE